MRLVRSIRSSIRRGRARSRLFNFAGFIFTPIGLLWIIIWLGSHRSGWDALGGFLATLLVAAILAALGRRVELRFRSGRRWARVDEAVLAVVALGLFIYVFDLGLWGAVAASIGLVTFAVLEAQTNPRRSVPHDSVHPLGRFAPQTDASKSARRSDGGGSLG